MRLNIKIFLCTIAFSGTVCALPMVNKEADNSESSSFKPCKHVSYSNLEYSYCLDDSDKLVKLDLKFIDTSIPSIHLTDNRCQILSEKQGAINRSGQILVQTQGDIKWSDLIRCVSKRYEDKYAIMPFSATPNLDTSIRSTLINSFSFQVFDFYARPSKNFVTYYLNDNATNSTQYECYQNDKREECQVLSTSRLPTVNIWLQKLNYETVVHEETFEASDIQEASLQEFINQYQARVQVNTDHAYGVYLTFLTAPDHLYAFVSGATPGQTTRVHKEHNYLDIEASSPPQDHIHYLDDRYLGTGTPNRLTTPSEWQSWYNRLSVSYSSLPTTGSRYTYSLKNFFFYESDKQNKGLRFERKLVTEQEMQAVLAAIRLAVYKPESRCLAEQLKVVRLTSATDGKHVLEAVYEPSANDKQEACAKRWLYEVINPKVL